VEKGRRYRPRFLATGVQGTASADNLMKCAPRLAASSTAPRIRLINSNRLSFFPDEIVLRIELVRLTALDGHLPILGEGDVANVTR
jgi:hypothetical protein